MVRRRSGSPGQASSMRLLTRSIEHCTCGAYRSGRFWNGVSKLSPPSSLTAWVRWPTAVPSCSRPLTRIVPSVRSASVSSPFFCSNVPSAATSDVSVAPSRQ